jgi:hypothetical protein
MPQFDFELLVDGEAVQLIRVFRKTFGEAQIAAEESAAEFRGSTMDACGDYTLEFIREIPASTD